MRLTRCLLSLLVLAGLSPAMAQTKSDDTKVVVFSRHTFRGVTPFIGPKPLSLPIKATVPVLSYSMEASPRGLEVARQFGSDGLNRAAALALKGLGRKFDGRWDEIRADLSCSRNFFTGLYLRKGFQAAHKGPVLLTGCPTRESQGVDAVTMGSVARRHISGDEMQRLRAASPNQERMRKAGESLLNELGAAIGAKGPFTMPAMDAHSLDPAYGQLVELASSIEMTADVGPPVERLFPQAPKATVRKHQAAVVRKASDYLGMTFAATIPMEAACVCSVVPLEFMNATAPGRRVVAVSHDDDVSSLCRALGLIADDGKLEDLAIYPLESIVFALSPSHVRVTRMRIHVGHDGQMPGPFDVSLLWDGSRAAWDKKVQSVVERANGWTAAAAARAEVHLLPAQRLDVLEP